MINQQHIDLLTLIPTPLKRVASTAGGEYHGPCPFCGGTDRFVVQPEAGRWMCRQQCSASDGGGDAIKFVMKYENKTFPEALAALKLESEQQRQPVQRTKTPSGPRPSTGNKDALCLTSDHWQQRAQSFAMYAWTNLHNSDVGRPAMDYLLNTRKLTAPVIGCAPIGYNPTYIRDNWGGKEVHLPPGIVFIWEETNLGRVMRLNFRLSNPVNGQRYIQVAGGTNWLWNSLYIAPDSIVVLVEGEIDALSVYSAAGRGRICPVATGSTTGSRMMRWVARLSMASHVLVAFDDDDAGKQASDFWLKVLPNARRAVPEHKDINEMLRYGVNIKQWIQSHIKERI